MSLTGKVPTTYLRKAMKASWSCVPTAVAQ